jgi:hypothetical protein
MIEVPLRLVADEDDPGLFLPYVVVEIDGVPVEALLDSGASRTHVVDRPGLVTREASARASSSAFGAGTSVNRTATVACRLGGVDLPVDAAVVPPDHPGHGDLVGQDVLSRFRCGYRLADGLLLLDPDLPGDSSAIYLDHTMHVSLDVAWEDGPTASAAFDTGASITVVDQAFADRHPELFRPAGTSAGSDATGATAETPMAVMRGPEILGVSFGDAAVAIVDLSGANSTLRRPMDLILGWTVTSQAAWIIDHTAARASCVRRPTGHLGGEPLQAV